MSGRRLMPPPTANVFAQLPLRSTVPIAREDPSGTPFRVADICAPASNVEAVGPWTAVGDIDRVVCVGLPERVVAVASIEVVGSNAALDAVVAAVAAEHVVAVAVVGDGVAAVRAVDAVI